ncbi:uncharacterized protein LY79DRAFT_190633 [Colletotrichum navitas]|uniref:Uncharacterized protein n=1 Tax=Colletotrichum navitas TaxID=681940 RepID=A0AAD8V652_9PEZI|nr:uncharacterized protein LY79DRAFT_190633 [Colletotrichum navitas]KAK1593196.1 hypothetical protein LY79DRAFT_190633 [Colletotrichum navitas]
MAGSAALSWGCFSCAIQVRAIRNGRACHADVWMSRRTGGGCHNERSLGELQQRGERMRDGRLGNPSHRYAVISVSVETLTDIVSLTLREGGLPTPNRDAFLVGAYGDPVRCAEQIQSAEATLPSPGLSLKVCSNRRHLCSPGDWHSRLTSLQHFPFCFFFLFLPTGDWHETAQVKTKNENK